MSERRAQAASACASAVVAALLVGCDSPYQRQGILSDDVAHRLSSMEAGDVARLGEAGPLASSIVAPPTPDWAGTRNASASRPSPGVKTSTTHGVSWR